MKEEEFIDIFRKKLEKIDIEMNSKQLQQFYKYMLLLIEWNKKVNLTAIIEPKEIIDKHFIDSLLTLKYIERDKKIIDVGTGAGFPGIPIKIALPDIKITLLDSLNKRINFLKEVKKEFGLSEIEFVHGRAEDEGKNSNYRETFDFAISRAVASLNILLEYMSPFIKKNGKCICMKSNKTTEEINSSKNAMKELKLKIEKNDEYILPDTDNKRNIIMLEKTGELSKMYPRKTGTPSKKPL